MLVKQNKRFESNNDRRYKQKRGGKDHNAMTDRKESRMMPLDFSPTHKGEFRRRYATTNGINATLYIYDLLKAYMMSSAAALLNSLVYAIRLKRLQIWTPVTTNGTPVFVTVKPVGVDVSSNSFADLGITLTDSSQTLDRVAYVDLKTKKTLPSGCWHRSIAADLALVEIVCAAGSILDLDFEFVGLASSAASTFTSVCAGATVGTVYCRPILTNFIPLGVNQI